MHKCSQIMMKNFGQYNSIVNDEIRWHGVPFIREANK